MCPLNSTESVVNIATRREYMELDDIKIYDKDTITIYETSDLTITSDNPNPSYAKAGDIITVTLWTNDIITNSYMQMLNRTIVPTIYNNTLVANLTIHDSDANGNPAFDIILVGINDNQTVSELNLTGSNIFIDTIKPNLTLNGTPIIHTELGHDYIDPGTTLHDNDPCIQWYRHFKCHGTKHLCLWEHTL